MSDEQTMHVFHFDHTEWWVARDLEHLEQLIKGDTGETIGEMYGVPADEAATQLDDDSELELWWNEALPEVSGCVVVKESHGHNLDWTHKVLATCAAWVSSQGAGFLATTEW